MIRMAILEDAEKLLSSHLLNESGIEQGAFCLVHEGKGLEGTRLLVTEALLPPPGAWEYQESDTLRPSAQWISAAVSRAIEARCGLMFVHSHPNALHPPGLSIVDMSSFYSLAKTLAPMLDGPFAAAVVHPQGWAGALWANGRVVPIERIVSVGRTLNFLNPLPPVDSSRLDSRQKDALGFVHERIRSLTVAVVGCGGLGSPIAEQLVRMGVAELIPLDHDMLDTESNVRRIFGSKVEDLREPPESKVIVVGRYLESLGLGVKIRPVKADVRTEEGFRHLLDADLVFSATDTHGSRAIINDLASSYLLPVIDVGVRVGSKADSCLSGLLAEVRVLTPTTPCLWCRGTISADVIRAENLPSEERERLEREGYVVGHIGGPVPSVVALTVLGSGLATSALLTLLSEEGEVAPSGYWVDGFLGDSHVMQPIEPKPDCRCRQQLGMGDHSAPPFISMCSEVA